MTSKWKKGIPQSTEELEDSMSQELADLGMLEQGMTFQDKQELISAIRLSQKSARAEEKERNTKVPHTQPNSAHNGPHDPLGSTDDVEDDVSTSNQNENGEQHDGEVEDDEDGDINQDILSNISMVVSECDPRSLSNAKAATFGPVPNFDEGGELGEVASERSDESKTKQRLRNSPNSVITVSSKDSENGSISGEHGGTQNGAENENGTRIEQASSDNENDFVIISGKGKQGEPSNIKRRKDDRERNIDVFSFSSGAEQNFVRSCMNKNEERVPFYFVPEGMGVRKYIAYFKCCVNQYYNNLANIQKNSIEHMEWGPPISMEVGFTSMRPQSAEQGDNSRRYNFRDRYPKQKVLMYRSENSEEGEEDESNDEEMFVPHNKKLTGIKLSTKRKNTSMNDSLSTKKEKKESSTGQRRLLGNGEMLEEETQIDQSFDSGNDFLDKMGSRGRNSAQSRKRARRSRQKSMQHSIESQDDMSEGLPVDPTSMASIIEPDIVIAEGPAPDLPMLTCNDISRSALSVKQRRLQLLSDGSSRLNRRKSEPRKNPDVVLLEDVEQLESEEAVEKISCPICGNSFPMMDIQEHASECNQYSPDNSSCSTKV